MIYSNRLQALRERIGLTQAKAGQLINLDSGTYNNYEKEKILIPIKHLNVFSNYYDVSFDYLFNFTETKQYKNNNKNINLNISGERLKNFRKELKYTQAKLAEILNISRTTITEYENGHLLISLPNLYTICKKYKVSADYLLGKIDNKIELD